MPRRKLSGAVSAMTGDGRLRAVIDAMLPTVDGGPFPVKCVAGDRFEVTAHCFTDDHDALRVMLTWRVEDQGEVHEIAMEPAGNDDWQALWAELKSVLDHWVGEGVKIFRVDDPHTKAFAFWEWAITHVKREHPEVIFPAEAFTRPKAMHRLAKPGFTQSCTCFTWRNTSTTSPGTSPNWRARRASSTSVPMSGPIRPTSCMNSCREASRRCSRRAWCWRPPWQPITASTGQPLSWASTCRASPAAGNTWTRGSTSCAPRATTTRTASRPLSRVNRIRRANPALQADRNPRFLGVDNDQSSAYAKASAGGTSVVVTGVNLDPYNTHSGWLQPEPESIGVASTQSFQMRDLLSDQRFVWQGARHFIRVDPPSVPAQILVVRRLARDERDFDCYL